MHAKHLSDHSPICIRVSGSSPPPSSSRPIPSFVTKHPHYRTMVAFYEKKLGLTSDNLCNSSNNNPFHAIPKYKSILRRAAADTRKFLPRIGDDPLINDSLLTTISRAVSQQNVRLANFLTAVYPLARNHIEIRDLNYSRTVFSNLLKFVDGSCPKSALSHLR